VHTLVIENSAKGLETDTFLMHSATFFASSGTEKTLRQDCPVMIIRTITTGSSIHAIMW